MNVHYEKPACYTTTPKDELPIRAPRFHEGGKWCYAKYEETVTHTPGCFGCTRAKDNRITEAQHVPEPTQGIED